MEWIFRNASSFNQNLGDWDMSNVTNVTDMFRNSGLSMNNYDQILIGWANQTLKNNLNFTSPTTYSCLAASSRENIINDFNWTIIDSGFLDNVLPTATTQDLTVQLNASGSATITAAQIDNGSTDNCGIATITVNPNSFTAANLGDNTVTLTVTDTSGNVSTATAVVTVEDNIAPTAITQNITVNLDANGNATITTAQIDNGSTDNAGIASMTVSPNAFTCEDLGTNTVILTVTDTSGNISTATATVTVQDTVLPTVITQDITVQLNASGAATITAAQIDNGSTDNCGIASMTVSPNTFTCDDLGPITVTLTVTDTSGNVATAVAIVTVQDLVAPVVSTTSIASTPDINGYTCGATFSFETTQTTCFVTKSIAKPIWADSCALTYTQSADNNVILTNLGDMVLGNFPLGTTTITFTSTDLSGNTSSCNVLVTVVDSVAPVLSQCPTGGTYEVDSNLCSLQLNLSSPLIIDNCGVSTVTYATAGATELSGIGFPSSLVFNLGVTQVLYTVTDESGNATTCSYAITVVDTTAPEIQAENFTVSVTSGCSEDVALGVTATDNCGTPTLVGARSDGLALTSAFPLGTTTVTWTATDASGNTFTATQEITVVDNAAPVIAGMPANITIGNDAGSCDATVTWTAPTATDNCAGVTLTSSHLPGDLFALGTTTVTYTATDAAGNTSSASFTVTVNDTENPTITAPADVTVSANASCLAFNVVLGSPVTSDNCGVGFVTNDAPGTFLLGITTVTWTVTDNAGNTATATQNVTVEDITAPTIFAPTDLTVNANNDCEAVIANLGNVVATDNCDTVTVTNDAPAAFPLGTTTVTWIATDASGNTSTATQEITVVDTTAPVVLAPQSITISAGVDSCSVTNVDLGVPTATDNCGITSVTNDAPTTFPSGTTTVIWTATDNAGNTSTASQTVTVIDQVAPVALTQNITAALSNEGTVTISASQIDNGSFDNCGGVTLSVAPNTFGCSQIGTNEVVLTVTDASGNSSTATATVTIVDTTAPLALVSPVTVSLNAQGLATLTASQVNNGSFDNCGIAQISISQTSFDCDDVGSNTIQFTATDFSGNSTTVNATVIVVDTIAPTIVTQNLTLDVSYEEPVTISPDEISLGTFDNCGIDYMILSQNTFGCEDFGENVVELTVVDLSGNESRSTFTVTVNRCTVRVSEAVTPNGDGINDTWMIYNIEQYPNNRVRVFNRWGDKVFESKSYRNTWDGSYRNRSQKLPEAGSYYYQLDLDDDGVIDQDGWIYITR
jgi:gliding motility-associated-like protein